MLLTKQNPLNVETLRDYLKHKITNWYRNAKLDYDVNGRFKNIKTCGEHLVIVWEEEGKEQELEIVYYNDYTLEQLYNIWMEG